MLKHCTPSVEAFLNRFRIGSEFCGMPDTCILKEMLRMSPRAKIFRKHSKKYYRLMRYIIIYGKIALSKSFLHNKYFFLDIFGAVEAQVRRLLLPLGHHRDAQLG